MEEQIKTAPQTDVEVVDIQFRPGQKIYFFDPDGQRFAEGDHIIIDTARGEEFGICVGGNHKIPPFAEATKGEDPRAGLASKARL